MQNTNRIAIVFERLEKQSRGQTLVSKLQHRFTLSVMPRSTLFFAFGFGCDQPLPFQHTLFCIRITRLGRNLPSLSRSQSTATTPLPKDIDFSHSSFIVHLSTLVCFSLLSRLSCSSRCSFFLLPFSSPVTDGPLECSIAGPAKNENTLQSAMAEWAEYTGKCRTASER